MVLHEGESAYSGHYTSLVKHVANGQSSTWYNINDSTVTTCSAPLRFSPSDHALPYILFYVNVDERDASLSQAQRRMAFSRIETVTNEESNTTCHLGVNAVLKELFHQTEKVTAAKRKGSDIVPGATVPQAKQFKGKRRQLFTQSDSKRKSDQRRAMSQEQKSEERNGDKVRKSSTRASMTNGRKEEERNSAKVRMSSMKASMSNERKDEELTSDRTRKASKRAAVSSTQQNAFKEVDGHSIGRSGYFEY